MARQQGSRGTKQDLMEELLEEYGGELRSDKYTIEEWRIKELQKADADTLEEETIKMLLWIYQNAMNTAETFMDLVNRGDGNSKTKEAINSSYGEANKSMTNMINLIKNKKAIDMNKMLDEKEEPQETEDGKIKIDRDSINRMMEEIDAEEEVIDE